MIKLTPWFTGDQKPVRVGVYQRDLYGEDVKAYSYWDGEVWGLYGETYKLKKAEVIE